eukprot:54083_1
MDVNNKEDNELIWIAEEGLKAPLPPEWKPCKTNDDDIYYFNFESGESRWEHPCDLYYKKLFKTEKQKFQKNKLKKKQTEQKQEKQIQDNFDSMFQNEIETILESDPNSSTNELDTISESNEFEAIKNEKVLKIEKKLQSEMKLFEEKFQKKFDKKQVMLQKK